MEILTQFQEFFNKVQAPVRVIRRSVDSDDTAQLRCVLEDDPSFRSEFVDCLPWMVKDLSSDSGALMLGQLLFTGVVTSIKTANDPKGTVVLTRCKRQYLRFMNSQGSDWADMGFFKVQSTDVLNCGYFYVFWYDTDLSFDERNEVL